MLIEQMQLELRCRGSSNDIKEEEKEEEEEEEEDVVDKDEEDDDDDASASMAALWLLSGGRSVMRWAGGSVRLAFESMSRNMASMSTRDCRISRYTMPMKFRGKLS